MTETNENSVAAPEAEGATEKKREVRTLREQIRKLRATGKDIAEERKKLTERFDKLSEELGTPPRGSKGGKKKTA